MTGNLPLLRCIVSWFYTITEAGKEREEEGRKEKELKEGRYSRRHKTEGK